MSAASRLLIVSNRLPVTISTDAEGRTTVRRSVGGLATGLRGPHERSQGLWIGWPGPQARPETPLADDVRRQLEAMRAVPVPLSEREEHVYYGRLSNGVLWPICHDRLERMPLHITGWDVYEQANARFADAVAEHWRPGDVVWVHDYQLLRVPALVRERIPEARIGFFLHIPFPNPEIFLALPVRDWLVEGMMGADLIGFHTRRYRGHFAAALRRLFRVEATPHWVAEWQGRAVRLGVYPMGVDAARFAARAARPEVEAEVRGLRVNDQRLLVGIDRLDYSKGIPRRIMALERLLVEHPEWREKVRLVQVAVPSRSNVSAYRKFREEIDALIGRVNGELSTPTWTPIHYLYRSVPEPLLLGLYRAADVMLVTPVRDGMNLVAKEFVASRVDDDGVLVLSELAGAADELTDALLVNPYDVDGIMAAMRRALAMGPEERHDRMRKLRAHVREYDVHRWAQEFLGDLEGRGAD